MANPTTNFGWVMPTSASLVTNLPADFATFGQAVDTSMAQLKGGTTGQVLSKTSNTDMAFTWVTDAGGDITSVGVTSPITGGGTSGAVTIAIDDATTSVKGAVQLTDSTSTTSSVLAGTATAVKSAYDLANAAIAKSLVTTAGDIIYRNATVPARLAIGTANQLLRVNAGATAPEWATISTSPTFAGAQATADGTSFSYTSGVATLVPFATENFDTNGFHSTSSNTGRLTIPSGGDGKYLFTLDGLSIGTVPSYSYVKLYKNGSVFGGGNQVGAMFSIVTGNNNGQNSGAIIASAVATDYFEVYIQSDQSTGTKTLYGMFSCSFLGA